MGVVTDSPSMAAHSLQIKPYGLFPVCLFSLLFFVKKNIYLVKLDYAGIFLSEGELGRFRDQVKM